MPKLAPSGALPSLTKLLGTALLGLVDRNEIRDELERQLDHFERGLSFPPDQVDGHQQEKEERIFLPRLLSRASGEDVIALRELLQDHGELGRLDLVRFRKDELIVHCG